MLDSASGQGADAGDAEDEDAGGNSISHTRGLLQVRHCSGCFAHIISLNSHVHRKRWGSYFCFINEKIEAFED